MASQLSRVAGGRAGARAAAARRAAARAPGSPLPVSSPGTASAPGEATTRDQPDQTRAAHARIFARGSGRRLLKPPDASAARLSRSETGSAHRCSASRAGCRRLARRASRASRRIAVHVPAQLCKRDRNGTAARAAARRGGGVAVEHDRGAQREPRAIDRMDHELPRRQRAEARGDGDPLERQERAVVLAMGEADPRAGERARDRALGVAVERIALAASAGSARAARNSGHSARVLPTSTRGARRPRAPRARARARPPRSNACAISKPARVSERERIHAATMAQSQRAGAAASRADRAATRRRTGSR